MADGPLGVVVAALERSSLLKLDLSENCVGGLAMGKLCAFLEEDNCLEVIVLFAVAVGVRSNKGALVLDP